MLQFNRQEWESSLTAASWRQTEAWRSHPDARGLHNIVSAMDLLAKSEQPPAATSSNE
jgi:hypothetical protein